jgi:hypothetical protein
MNDANAKPAEQAIRGARIQGMVRAGPIRPWCVTVLFAATLLLQACDTTNYAAKQEAKTPDAPAAPTDIVVGSRLTLRMPLILPAAGAPLLFQSNAIVTPAQLVRNVPFCRFAPTSAGADRAIKPEIFVVRSVDYDERQTADPGMPVSVTHYRLDSSPSRTGYLLSCGWPTGAPAPSFVTVDQVQESVSAFFRIDSAQ